MRELGSSLFYWDNFSALFYAYSRRVVNFLENAPFGHLMGRPQNTDFIYIGNFFKFCRCIYFPKNFFGKANAISF